MPDKRALTSATVGELKSNSLRTFLIRDASGRFIGEVSPLHDGSWLASVYGPDYGKGGVPFPDFERARDHIAAYAGRSGRDTSPRFGTRFG